MPCSTPTYIQVCTDADTYSVNATSIDVQAELQPGAGTAGRLVTRVDYSFRIEYWNGSSWELRGYQTGYFAKRSPVKVFPIKDLKLPKGKNSVRLTANYTVSYSNGDKSYDTQRPPAFVVYR